MGHPQVLGAWPDVSDNGLRREVATLAGMRLSLVFLFMTSLAAAQTTHYSLKVTPDFAQHILRADEAIEFDHSAGVVEFQKQPGLEIAESHLEGGDITVQPETIRLRLQEGGKHTWRIRFAAAPHRGILWFSEQPGFDTAFHCEAWMVCDTNPANRATLDMEIVVPKGSELTPVAPGQFTKKWEDAAGAHFLFRQSAPVQTYLFSFGVAKLSRLERDEFIVYVPDAAEHKRTFERTAKAYEFLREKAGTELPAAKYTQAVMANGIEQEAAALALMPKNFLRRVEEQGDDRLLAHELAHQWWGVLVGIRSWSDFWLNEGMADFMQDAFLEKEKGKAAYEGQIAGAKREMEELRNSGKDRPLHWDGWKDATGALGRIPYVKGELFLDRLRSELGESAFWHGLAVYTTRNAGRLVDSKDFEAAMEEASGRDLRTLFDEAVYR